MKSHNQIAIIQRDAEKQERMTIAQNLRLLAKIGRGKGKAVEVILGLADASEQGDFSG